MARPLLTVAAMHHSLFKPLALAAIACVTGCALDATTTPTSEATGEQSSAMRICPRWAAAATRTVQYTGGGMAYAQAASTAGYGAANCDHAWIVDYDVPDPISGFNGRVPTFTEEGTTGSGPNGWNPPNLSNIKTPAECATFRFNAWIYGDGTLLQSTTATGVWNASLNICGESETTILEITNAPGYLHSQFRIGVAAYATVAGALVYYPVESFVVAR